MNKGNTLTFWRSINKKITGISLIILFIILASLLIELDLNKASTNIFSDNKTTGEVIGNTSYGYVEKEVYGNQSSNETVIIITGVHPRESEFHNVTAAAVKDKSENLSKKYILYKIHVTKNALNFDTGRMKGQLLANKFVVPDVIKIKPQIVVDIHEDLGESVGYR